MNAYCEAGEGGGAEKAKGGDNMGLTVQLYVAVVSGCIGQLPNDAENCHCCGTHGCLLALRGASKDGAQGIGALSLTSCIGESIALRTAGLGFRQSLPLLYALSTLVMS
jgi:hypothetical protein